ncbi:hypothetical protein [Sulfurimonas sp.]
MKTDVKIYAFVKEDAKTFKNIVNNYDCLFIKDYEELQNKIDNISYLDSHLLLIDLDYIVNEEGKINRYIRRDLMRSWLCIVGYSNKNLSLHVKKSLYRLDFRAILDNSNAHIHSEILNHVRSYASIYTQTMQNNFIKALFHCNNLDVKLQELKYLLSYIADYYKLSIQDIADIYLVTSSLIIAIKTDTLIQTSEVLYTLFKSLEINKLYKNYVYAETLNEQLVTIILRRLHLKNVNKYLETVNIKQVEEKLVQEVSNFYEAKSILISSYWEIDFFWEQINEILFSYYKNDDFGVLEHYLEIIYSTLVESLNRVGYVRAYINTKHEQGIALFIKLYNVNDTISQECFDFIKINENTMSKKMHKEKNASSEIMFTLNLSKKIATKKVQASVRKHNILKQTNIETMHYQDNQKVSAQEFLQEFEVDNDMLDDLNENETEIKNILFSEVELNDKTIEAVSVVLDKYVKVLHETIEFNDLAISLESLSRVFQRLSVTMLEAEKKEKLRFYIQGLIDDLQNWKKYIFIEPNTPDIHYLDASLLENCASIEYFIFATPEEEVAQDDDNDLEFF